MDTLNLNPNYWSCLPTSVANVIGVPVKEFINEIGHDGSEFPYAPPHECIRRGFHTQECINVLIDKGYAATPIEFFPSLKPAEDATGIAVSQNAREFFWQMLGISKGFICGQWEGVGHCVANFKGNIIDPRYEWSNKVYCPYDFYNQNFTPLVYFKVDKCT
jgi:hypothetical protein